MLDPEKIHLIFRDEVVIPDRTLGMDTNWILKHLMDTEERPHMAVEAIDEIEDLIEKAEFDEARAKMALRKKEGLDIPEWSVLEARIARLELTETLE